MTYWICARTRMGDEVKVQKKLSSDGYQVYLPMVNADTRTKRQVKTKTAPLFPSYLFVFVFDGITDIHDIKKSATIVMTGNEPTKASTALIDIVRRRESEAQTAVKYRYEAGDRIRLVSGALKDFEAEIINLSRSDRALIQEITTGKRYQVPVRYMEPIYA